jgi:hypothetical protein
MAQKVLLCFANICAKIVLYISGYSFCTRAPYFSTILPNFVATKSIDNYLRKSCSALVAKMLVKLVPGVNFFGTNNATISVIPCVFH